MKVKLTHPKVSIAVSPHPRRGQKAVRVDSVPVHLIAIITCESVWLIAETLVTGLMPRSCGLLYVFSSADSQLGKMSAFTSRLD